MDAVESFYDGMLADGCILTLALLVPVSNWIFWAHINHFENDDFQKEALAALIFCTVGTIIFLVRQCMDSICFQSYFCCMEDLKRNFRPSKYFGLEQFTYDTGYNTKHDTYSETCTMCHGCCYCFLSSFTCVPHVVLSALVLSKRPDDVYAALNFGLSACGLLLCYRGLQHMNGKELYPDLIGDRKPTGLNIQNVPQSLSINILS
jgi:hypothetical protein